MITNVTSVLIGNGYVTALPEPSVTNVPSQDAGKFIIVGAAAEGESTLGGINKPARLKFGVITAKNNEVRTANGVKYVPVIKWAPEIKSEFNVLSVSQYVPDTEDKVEITFNNNNSYDVKRILLRVTYKDMETRYRKWTETYEYIAQPNETAAQIAQGFNAVLAKNYKRNRFSVALDSTKLTLTANKYTDDDAVDTINVSKKVRFDVHMYYTMPNADGWATKNKYAYTDATIVKTDGTEYTASTKLVRDRESWAMGYEGILNRGEGTWPIIKPAMTVDLSESYNSVTIEYYNEYRAADDIVRKTRNTIEIYEPTSAAAAAKAAASDEAKVGLSVVDFVGSQLAAAKSMYPATYSGKDMTTSTSAAPEVESDDNQGGDNLGQ